MKLSEKEKRIIQLIGEAKTNREIAKIIGVKETSVGVYICNLCRMTDSKNRIDLYNKYLVGEI